MKYINNEIGNIPLLISVPHGGYLSGENFKDREKGCFEKDKNLISTFKSIKKEFNKLGLEPYYVYSRIKRIKVDLNRDKNEVIKLKKNLLHWEEYHALISKYINEIDKKYNKGIYIDLHGQSTRDYLEIGYGSKEIISKYISKKSFGSILEKNGVSCFPSFKNKKVIGRYRDGGFCNRRYNKNNIKSVQIEIDKKWRKDKKNRELFADKFTKSLIAYLNIS